MDSPTLSAACYLDSPPWTPPIFEDTQPQLPKTKRGKNGGKKAAWKPNNDQLRILDQHLNAGQADPVPLHRSIALPRETICNVYFTESTAKVWKGDIWPAF